MRVFQYMRNTLRSRIEDARRLLNNSKKDCDLALLEGVVYQKNCKKDFVSSIEEYSGCIVTLLNNLKKDCVSGLLEGVVNQKN